MRSRFAAIIVLAAAVALGTSGCGLITPQSTTIHYDASDGVSGDVGDLGIRNAMIVADEDGSTGNLVFTAVNSSDNAHELELGIGDSTETVTVEAGTSVSFGTLSSDDSDTPDPVVFPLGDASPGSTMDVFFQYGNETGLTLEVPVLTGDLQEYSTLVPTAPSTDDSDS